MGHTVQRSLVTYLFNHGIYLHKLCFKYLSSDVIITSVGLDRWLRLTSGLGFCLFKVCNALPKTMMNFKELELLALSPVEGSSVGAAT